MNTKLELTTLATCWHLKLRDGATMGFTEADRDIEVSGLCYTSRSGFSRSAIASSSNLAVDNLEVEGILDSELIKSEDLLSGKFDYAEVQIFLVDFTNPESGKIGLRTGWLGEISVSDGKFTAEIRGLFQAFSQNLGELYSPQCRAQLGDARCKVNLEPYKHEGKVGAILSHEEIADFTITQRDGFYRYGVIEFASGFKAEVISHFGHTLSLSEIPADLSIGDSFVLYPGCDKDFETCINKFHNAVNFRGEPFIPEAAKMLF